MHYIRLLRAPKVRKNGNRQQVSLLFTITTDLGDSFLFPDEFIDLQLVAHVTSPTGNTASWPLSDKGKLPWKPGMRVAKPSIDIPKTVQTAIFSGAKIEICIRATDAARSADGVFSILAVPSKKRQANGKETGAGLIMPAWVPLVTDNRDIDVFTRRLYLGDTSDDQGFIEIEEEIGESIARHIWDAGVVALCAIAGIVVAPNHVSSKHACIQAMRDMMDATDRLRVLELGCGVGILGVGLGAVYPKLHPHADGDCTVLMTDLDEGEARARANIARLEGMKRSEEHDEATEPSANIIYENLDWEDGKLGNFGPEASSQPWDLVILSDCTYNVDMLPTLVATLSSLHARNSRHASEGERFTTKVFLATKPRHASERALFDLMAKENWATLHTQVLSLPVLGAEPESVEMYLFEKT